MGKLHLTMAVGDYDRTRSLVDGSVTIEGVEMTVLPFSEPAEMFHRTLRKGEFDVSEMSMATSIVGSEKGFPFVTIPVFPRRVFRHSSIYVRAGSGIAKPKDLEGRRVGIALFQNTAAVWAKGVLQHDYGVDLDKILWVAEKPENYRLEIDIPLSSKLETLPFGRSLEMAIESGEIDAAISPRHMKSMASSKGAGVVSRLFPNYQEVEKEYYQKTGIFPIHHTVVIKKEVYEQNRWLATSLVKAFREAKARCFELRYWPGRYSIAWTNAWLDMERQILGNDPWPYDLGKENRLNIDTLVRYCYEQGILTTKPQVEKIFAENTLAE